MAEVELPGNSNKSKTPEERPEVQRVTTSDVVRRKKPLGKRIGEAFSGDDARSVGSYILMDVLIPATKDLIVDVVIQSVQRSLYGTSRPTRSMGSSNAGPVPYNRYSGNSRTTSTGPGRPPWGRDEPRRMSKQSKSNHNFDEIVIQSRIEAETILDSLRLLIEKYEVATVTDLYKCVGITADFTDNDWGWYDLSGAAVVRIREGYLVDLPGPEPLFRK